LIQITNRRRQKTKRKKQYNTDDKLNGLPKCWDRGSENHEVKRVPDDKLNEHEGIRQIYTQRNLHRTRENRHVECEKIHYHTEQRDTKKTRNSRNRGYEGVDLSDYSGRPQRLRRRLHVE